MHGKNIIPKDTYTEALLAAMVVFGIYAFFLTRNPYPLFGSSPSNNIFVYLADSFLKGRLDLDFHSRFFHGGYNDLSFFNSRAYAYWPPLCAFLLMPAVLMHGIYIGERWFNVLFATVSVFASWLTIGSICTRFGWIPSRWYKTVLCAFLAFGTSYLIFSLSAFGNQWYMAQAAAAMMMSLAVTSALRIKDTRLRLILSGTFWALAILSRLHLILAVPFFLYIAVVGTEGHSRLSALSKESLSNITTVLTPVFLALIFIAWYNWARFGSVLQIGVLYHCMHPRYVPNFYKFGYLSLHYLWHNTYYTLLRLPIFEHQHFFREPDSPHNWEEGYSFFYQSPVFLYAFACLHHAKKNFVVGALWLSAVLVAFPILCCMGTGWIQFGARYLFDICPLLFPLVIIGTRARVTPVLILLVTASILVNLFGLKLLGGHLTCFQGQPLLVAWRQDPNHALQAWPSGWHMQLPPHTGM